MSDALFTPPPGTPVADVSTRARRPDLVSAAAAVLGVDSCLVMLLGLQNTMMMRWYPPYDKAVYVLIALGILAAVLALRVARVDPRVQKLAIGGVVALLLGVGGWTAFSFASGVISMLGVVATLGALSSLVLLTGSLPACADSYAARQQLRAEGIEFNL